MKTRDKVIIGSSAALTALLITKIPWNLRQNWHITNKYVIDPDFNCNDLSILGIKLPCDGVGGLFNSIENISSTHIAEFAVVLAALGLVYWWSRRRA